MSTTLNQRAKGQPNQVSNGPGKEPMKDEFDAYNINAHHPQMTPWSASDSLPRHHMQGGYGSAPMSSPSVSETPYMPSYYPSVSFPYSLNQGLSEGAWSNGGDPMSFLGSYGQMDNNYMPGNGMFGGFSYQPGFGWEFSGGEYSTWATNTTPQQPQHQQQQPQQPQQQQRKSDERTVAAAAAGYDTGYYNMGHGDGRYGSATMNGELDRDMKGMEQGLKSMNIVDRGGQDMMAGDGPHVRHEQNQMVLQAPPPGPAPTKKTWASIASQPAKPQTVMKPKAIPRAPMMPSKHTNMDIGTWENKNGSGKGASNGQQSRQAWTAPRGGRSTNNGQAYGSPTSGASSSGAPAMATSNGVNSGPPITIPTPSHPVLDKLRSANQYNPKEFNLSPKGARYFIIKSYSEDDIHRSIKYSIWCSTEHGNKRLDAAYREREGKGPIYFFFSVNGSGHFCGMAQMMSSLDYNSSSSVWAQDKWKGQTEVKWIYVKDVPNSQLRHIRLENNENKPVTNSRDTQEVPPEKGKQVLKILHSYRHTTSIFDDFVHYEKRQEEDQEEAPPMQQQQQQQQPGRGANRGRRGDGRGDGRGGGNSYHSNGNAQN